MWISEQSRAATVAKIPEMLFERSFEMLNDRIDLAVITETV